MDIFIDQDGDEIPDGFHGDEHDEIRNPTCFVNICGHND